MSNNLRKQEEDEIDDKDYNDEIFDELTTEYEYDTPSKFEDGSSYIEDNFWEKVEKFGKKLSFTKDIKALYNYFTDSSIPWHRKSIVIGALVYFIVPIDTIPDIAPLVGYLDDLGVITAVIKYMGSELIPFYDN